MIAVSPYYRRISISIVIAVFLYDNRLISVSIVVAVPVAVARPNGYANGPNTDPDLFCSAGIAQQIPATAAIITARRIVILCSYYCETS